jgi:hypothetical protein
LIFRCSSSPPSVPLAVRSQSVSDFEPDNIGQSNGS